MTPYHKRLTPLTGRMAEDMQVRNLSPRTIDSYAYHVDRFARPLRPAELVAGDGERPLWYRDG